MLLAKMSAEFLKFCTHITSLWSSMDVKKQSRGIIYNDASSHCFIKTKHWEVVKEAISKVACRGHPHTSPTIIHKHTARLPVQDGGAVLQAPWFWGCEYPSTPPAFGTGSLSDHETIMCFLMCQVIMARWLPE